jgi:hypothetical protein
VIELAFARDGTRWTRWPSVPKLHLELIGIAVILWGCGEVVFLAPPEIDIPTTGGFDFLYPSVEVDDSGFGFDDESMMAWRGQIHHR